MVEIIKPQGKIDWEDPGIHRGNLITFAGSERVTDRVCSIKWNSGAPVALELVTETPPLPGDYYIIAQIIIVHKSVYFYRLVRNIYSMRMVSNNGE